MLRTLGSLLLLAIWNCQNSSAIAQPKLLTAMLTETGDAIQVYRQGDSEPVVTQVARESFRPFLHPIVAPDGQGLMTESSPTHHPHQTGIFWGPTRVNGRDYFHHPGEGYWRRVSSSVLKAQALGPGDSVQWQTVYDLLDAEGQPVMRQSQIWTMRDEDARYILDLQWTGTALTDVTIGKYEYGGLFVRMPWTPQTAGQVMNNARHSGLRAEGQRSVWLDVGLQLAGRTDMAHFAIFDHPQNFSYPQAWRVDSQFGVGPVPTRQGDWSIAGGQQETIRHRLVAYTGHMSNAELMQLWSAYSGIGGDWVEWQLAQEAGLKSEFLTAEQTVAGMTVQEGYRANVFASEPMISQPMAFCWDAQGRLWVAENRDYETRQSGFSADGSSRILILEDTDGDGQADKSKVFLEGIPFPAAIAVGMGGLWLGAPPNLLFVPDSDGDDVADRQAIEVRLTGWGILDRHETLNSLHWGPDGWLYGLQGFATPSRVGKPHGNGRLYQHNDPFPEEVQLDGPAVDINGGVWRYHPFKQRFEVVAHGFSNPWGIDYDEHGQLFITACVIPHLWHVIPGGIYHRQGGRHFNPYVYDDIKTIAQHRHRSAHGGARVYQSDAFAEKYRGRVFMANIHEHAILTDIVHPSGSGFVAEHGDDFGLANNEQWIGFSVEVGPDGSVFVLDWHDADICGKQVLTKDTGRIYRYSAINSQAAAFPNRSANLNLLDDAALAQLQSVPSAWHANHARTILQHRAHTRVLSPESLDMLREQLRTSPTAAMRLRALWTLHVCGAMHADSLTALLNNDQPYVRGWAIQLLCEDFAPPAGAQQAMLALAQQDESAVVRLFLAAAAQRVDTELRWQLIERLALRGEDRADHNIPKMLWFALEPLIQQNESRALTLAQQSQLSLISRFVARRLGDAQRLDPLLAQISDSDGEAQVHMLLGVRDSTDGRFDIQAPAAWATVASKLKSRGGQAALLADQLAQRFGDSQAATEMLQTLQDASAPVADRQQALQQLAGRQHPELRAKLVQLLDIPELHREAIRAIGAFDDPELARQLLRRYAELPDADKIEAIYALSTRSRYGGMLTDAIAHGTVPKRDVPAHVARLLRRIVGNRFVDVWGAVDQLDANQEAVFAKYRELLTPASLQSANLDAGRQLFRRACATCHQLHGDGGQVGPEITGANRGNLEYLLSNILTPSAIIQDDYRMHIVLTDDGRIHSGIPSDEDDRVLRLRVADRELPVVIPKSSIQSREIAAVSMMPEGILNSLSDQEVIDLLGYLQSGPTPAAAD
ncbi:MAG: PmoA family protein [Pirellulaceae bacterium]|nr:PmoA family protein [Pirellulaceae bacterium]